MNLIYPMESIIYFPDGKIIPINISIWKQQLFSDFISANTLATVFLELAVEE